MSNFFADLTEKLRPLGNTVNKTFNQGLQFAKEKLGTAQDVTELPSEYKLLEEKVEAHRLAVELLLKIAKNYTLPAYDYQPPIGEKVADFTHAVADRSMSTFNEGAKFVGVDTHLPGAGQKTLPEAAPSLSHALSRVSSQAAALMDPQLPVAAALKRFAITQDKMGNARLAQDQVAVSKFVNPLVQYLDVIVGDAMKARRSVMSARLTYDAERAKLKSASATHVDKARLDMEASEDEFVACVDDAMSKMKLVVDKSDLIRSLTDLASAQRAYFKAAAAALDELVPELEELIVTNDALASGP